MCQVCSVTVDQWNQTVGIGQDQCWDGSPEYLMECAPNSLCGTEMEVDWFAKGNFQYRVKRGCSTVPAMEQCYSGGSDLIQYKDCAVTCDPANPVFGNGCNTGLDKVGAKFSVGKVSQCYQCQYYQELDGNVNGLPVCGEAITGANSNKIPKSSCPLYADAACYWAASYHQDLTGAGEKKSR
jgi:hypothetical protein